MRQGGTERPRCDVALTLQEGAEGRERAGGPGRQRGRRPLTRLPDPVEQPPGRRVGQGRDVVALDHDGGGSELSEIVRAIEADVEPRTIAEPDDGAVGEAPGTQIARQVGSIP